MNYLESGYETVTKILGARPVGTAIVGGGLAMAVRGMPADDAVQFGALCGLTMSIGDVILSSQGWQTELASYMPDNAYFDIEDFVASGLVTWVTLYGLGVGGDDLTYSAIIGGVAGGSGGKVGTALLNMLGSKSMGNNHGSKVKHVPEGQGPWMSGPIKSGRTDTAA